LQVQLGLLPPAARHQACRCAGRSVLFRAAAPTFTCFSPRQHRGRGNRRILSAYRHRKPQSHRQTPCNRYRIAFAFFLASHRFGPHPPIPRRRTPAALSALGSAPGRPSFRSPPRARGLVLYGDAGGAIKRKGGGGVVLFLSRKTTTCYPESYRIDSPVHTYQRWLASHQQKATTSWARSRSEPCPLGIPDRTSSIIHPDGNCPRPFVSCPPACFSHRPAARVVWGCGWARVRPNQSPRWRF
jgi:hypothetical protein